MKELVKLLLVQEPRPPSVCGREYTIDLAIGKPSIMFSNIAS